MQEFPWTMILDFPHKKYVLKLPGYQAIIIFIIRTKPFKKFVGWLNY